MSARIQIRVAHVRVSEVSNRWNLEILTPKQMLQRLPIALAQVKAGNTSDNLLKQIIYSLNWANETT